MKMKEKELDLYDVLLDSDNRENIVLLDETGKEMEFEQVAVVPYGEGDDREIYCVLKPITKIEGVEDDQALPFLLFLNDEDDWALKVVEDETLAKEIFIRYYELLLDSDIDEDERSIIIEMYELLKKIKDFSDNSIKEIEEIKLKYLKLISNK